MLQKDSWNGEEVGRGGGCTSAGESTSQAQPAGRHHSFAKGDPIHIPGIIPPTSKPQPAAGGIKGPQGFCTWGDINKGEGMKKKNIHSHYYSTTYIYPVQLLTRMFKNNCEHTFRGVVYCPAVWYYIYIIKGVKHT